MIIIIYSGEYEIRDGKIGSGQPLPRAYPTHQPIQSPTYTLATQKSTIHQDSIPIQKKIQNPETPPRTQRLRKCQASNCRAALNQGPSKTVTEA